MKPLKVGDMLRAIHIDGGLLHHGNSNGWGIPAGMTVKVTKVNRDGVWFHIPERFANDDHVGELVYENLREIDKEFVWGGAEIEDKPSAWAKRWEAMIQE